MSPSISSSTYDLSLLTRSAQRWRDSSGLRCYYHDLLRDVVRQATLGPRLELGSGIGAIREIAPSVITSDVAKTPFVDRVVSAYAIEEQGCSWGAILAVDVLHHLCEPLRFFASAARSLRQGGRIVLAEPAATLLGRSFYRIFHHEPCRAAELQSPWRFVPDPITGEFANMGMAWAMFVRDRKETEQWLAQHGLKLIDLRFRDGLAYASTGGLSKPQILPTWGIQGLLRIERSMPQAWWRRAGLRMIITIEKIG